jgi:hypothetical protein
MWNKYTGVLTTHLESIPEIASMIKAVMPMVYMIGKIGIFTMVGHALRKVVAYLGNQIVW